MITTLFSLFKIYFIWINIMDFKAMAHGSGFTLVLSLTLVVKTVDIVTGAEVQDYCQWEEFEPTCPPQSVIVMDSALYGRMEHGRCVKRDYGYVGCTSDVMALSDARCSGRRTCNIGIPDKLFDRVSKCPEDLRRYLKASYSCLPVLDPGRRSCKGMAYAGVTSPSGVLASVVTLETGCGSAETPWLITVAKGQRIKLALYDFSRAPTSINETAEQPSPHCHVYAIIKEADATRSITICGGDDRVKQVYSSSSSSLELRFIAAQAIKSGTKYFLVRYEPVGCPDLPTPRGGWVKRDETTLEIGCDDPQMSWRLTCNGSTWLGNYENCTNGFFDKNAYIGNLPHASSVLLIILVAVFVGLVVVVIGLIYLRRKYRNGNGRPQRVPSDRGKAALHQDDPYSAGREYMQTKPQPLLAYQDKTEENEYAYVDEVPQIIAAGHTQNTLNKHRDMSDYRGPAPPGGAMEARRGTNGQLIPQYFILDPHTGESRPCVENVSDLYEKQRCKMHRPLADPRDKTRSICGAINLPI